jgi:hypothetical protein
VAKNAGLKEGVDYVAGDPFPNNPNLRTAKLLGNPVATTIKVIDRIGLYTSDGRPRWSYVASIPNADKWQSLSYGQKVDVIDAMYKRENGAKSSIKQFA